MRSLISSALLAFWALAFVPSVTAQPQSVESACSSLERSNIDCACVATRFAVYERVSATPAAKDVLLQGYYSALGLDNRYGEAFESLMSNPMNAMMIEEAYDPVGGRPSNITDYERGCVIAGAPKPSFSLPPSTPAVIQYIASCVASTGDERFCQCDAGRKTSHLTDREFEAYYRSFSDYGGDALSHDELSRSRGEAMGLSAEGFDELQARARNKLAPHAETDELYCSAILWADNEPGVDAKTRLDAGFKSGLVATLAPQAQVSKSEPATPEEKARAIVADSCAADGNSEQYCSCYSDEFETRVLQKAASPSVALAWALMGTSASSLSNNERITLTQSIPQSDHQTAGMMFMETMDMGENCSQGAPAEAERLKGTPRERMMQICVAENEDEALCDCMIGKMQAQFSEDDFELIVDIREAEYNGAEDPFATVAEERGLSASEAETALQNNPAIIGGTMAMGASLMQCMGGMPAMPMMPGMTQQ